MESNKTMFGITHISTYIIGTILVILLPGPNSMYCLATSARFGKLAGFYSIGGILLGDSILMTATALGAGGLFQKIPQVFDVVKVIGGLYLAYIGWNLLQAACKKWRYRIPQQNVANQTVEQPSGNVFYRALLLSLTNPKAILFLLSFFVQFVDPQYPHPLYTFAALAIILQMISFSYLIILVFSGHHLALSFRRRYKTVAVAMGLTGCLFIAFALQLISSKI